MFDIYSYVYLYITHNDHAYKGMGGGGAALLLPPPALKNMSGFYIAIYKDRGSLYT